MRTILTLLLFQICFGLAAQSTAFDTLHFQIEKAVNNRFLNGVTHFKQNATTKIENDKIIVTYRDKLMLISNVNPIDLSKIKRRKLDLDSITITFYIDHNWSEQRLQNQVDHNKFLLEELTKIYVNYYDSIGWATNYRESKKLFLENPLFYLAGSEIIDKTKFDQITRIPDFIFNTTGVFIDFNFNTSFTSIYPSDIQQNLYLFLLECSSLDERINSLLDGQANY